MEIETSKEISKCSECIYYNVSMMLYREYNINPDFSFIQKNICNKCANKDGIKRYFTKMNGEKLN